MLLNVLAAAAAAAAAWLLLRKPRPDAGARQNDSDFPTKLVETSAKHKGLFSFQDRPLQLVLTPSHRPPPHLLHFKELGVGPPGAAGAVGLTPGPICTCCSRAARRLGLS